MSCDNVYFSFESQSSSSHCLMSGSTCLCFNQLISVQINIECLMSRRRLEDRVREIRREGGRGKKKRAKSEGQELKKYMSEDKMKARNEKKDTFYVLRWSNLKCIIHSQVHLFLSFFFLSFLWFSSSYFSERKRGSFYQVSFSLFSTSCVATIWKVLM